MEHDHYLTSRAWYSTSSAPFPNTDVRVVGEAPLLILREWIQGATKCLIELVREKKKLKHMVLHNSLGS